MKFYEKKKLNTTQVKIVKNALRELLNIRTISECVFVIKETINSYQVYAITNTGLTITISIPIDRHQKQLYQEMNKVIRELYERRSNDTREVY